MNLLLTFTDEHWIRIQANAKALDITPFEAVELQLALGYPVLRARIDGVPPPPRKLQVVR